MSCHLSLELRLRQDTLKLYLKPKEGFYLLTACLENGNLRNNSDTVINIKVSIPIKKWLKTGFQRQTQDL